MDVDAADGRLHCLSQPDVEIAVHLRRKPGLDAHFGRAEVPGLARAPQDLLRRQEIALFLTEIPAEGTEAAPFDADVREVDVAVHNVGDNLADALASQMVRG